jgi:hypothetical protein
MSGNHSWVELSSIFITLYFSCECSSLVFFFFFSLMCFLDQEGMTGSVPLQISEL